MTLPLPALQTEHDQELANFEEIIKDVYSVPRQLRLDGIDVAGHSYPLSGTVGGDHIVFVDFAGRYDLAARADAAEAEGDTALAESLLRCQNRLGILLADVSGHSMTDALLAAMLHQAFLVGVSYELDHNGQVTRSLFEKLNTRFYRSSSVHKYVTMVYGEISSDGTFTFISAGHPPPLLFSAKLDRFVNLDPEVVHSCYPIGLFPSEHDLDDQKSTRPILYKRRFLVNELRLRTAGDILVLCSDGVLEHERHGRLFSDVHLERLVREYRRESALSIVTTLAARMREFSPPTDDFSLIVVKRT